MNFGSVIFIGGVAALYFLDPMGLGTAGKNAVNTYINPSATEKIGVTSTTVEYENGAGLKHSYDWLHTLKNGFDDNMALCVDKEWNEELEQNTCSSALHYDFYDDFSGLRTEKFYINDNEVLSFIQFKIENNLLCYTGMPDYQYQYNHITEQKYIKYFLNNRNDKILESGWKRCEQIEQVRDSFMITFYGGNKFKLNPKPEYDYVMQLVDIEYTSLR